MKLFTKEIEKAFEKQGDCSEKEMEEIKIICKLFNPCGAGTWYLYEKETDDIYWAFVELGDPTYAEMGTVSISELTRIKFPPFGLPIERDMFVSPGDYTLKEVWDIVKDGGHV